jgi:hypothetical protein
MVLRIIHPHTTDLRIRILSYPRKPRYTSADHISSNKLAGSCLWIARVEERDVCRRPMLPLY